METRRGGEGSAEPEVAVAGAPDGPDAAPEPSWWHRDHPTFTPLSGFFTGLAFALLVPGTFAAVLGWLFDNETATELFPLVLVTLAVPLTLLVLPRSRKFGRYMLLGVVATVLVVGGVAAAVLWYLVNYHS